MFSDKHKGRVQVGSAILPDGNENQCEFCLNGKNSFIKIHYPNIEGAFRKNIDIDFIPVKMTDGTFLTFVKNVRSSACRYSDTRKSVGTYFPHFITSGEMHIEPLSTFASILFVVSDYESIFYDFDAFSITLNSGQHIQGLVSENSELTGRLVEVGEHPVVAYFTGKLEILRSETALGVVSVRHQPSYGMGGPKGVSIKNRIAIQIDFSRPMSIDGVMESLHRFLRFLQVIAGRRQQVEALSFRPFESDDRTWLDLYWSLSERDHYRDRYKEDDELHPADMPVNGGTEPAGFADVMAAWLSNDKTRTDARAQFAQTSSKHRYYDLDRLISAANMFDILPSECFDAPESMPLEIKAARCTAKKLCAAQIRNQGSRSWRFGAPRAAQLKE